MLGISEEVVCRAGGVGTRVPLAPVGDFPREVKGSGRGPDPQPRLPSRCPLFLLIRSVAGLDEPLSVPETD